MIDQTVENRPSSFVEILEVGPRDGLQNEVKIPSAEEKQKFTSMLVGAGVKQIEVGSFVSPKAVPAMADSDKVASGIVKADGNRYLGLIMNDKGFDRAVSSGINGVCIVVVVSETMCQKNNGTDVKTMKKRASSLISRARQQGLFVRVDIATSWHCPYEGAVDRDKVLALADDIWAQKPDQMALCDTIGHAHPDEVKSLFDQAIQRYGSEGLAAHFHDTQGLALANVYAALESGIRIFDASVGGLGGCPFAPGARGNLATEDLVFFCNKLGYQTGIDLDKLLSCIEYIESSLDRSLGGAIRNYLASKK